MRHLVGVNYLITLLILPILSYCYRAVTNESLKHLAKLTDPSRLAVNGTLMKPLLVERVSGTPGNEAVRKFIVQHFKNLGWHVELDEFSDITPMGNKSFANIIVTENPERHSRLVMAAHYDSKYEQDFEFIGATDSAVPCGLLMNVAETINPMLRDESKNYRQSQSTLQFIFFDGEEAFKSWTDTDSIYGARHLAHTWETSMVPKPTKTSKNRLDQIEVLVLLDLLGTPNAQFHDFYPQTSWLFKRLMDLESRLNNQLLWKTVSTTTNQTLISLFNPDSMLKNNGGAIGDDHVPFLMRGVNILHLIPYPFPPVWHNRLDNADCIDQAVVENLALLFRSMAVEYLELDPLPHDDL